MAIREIVKEGNDCLRKVCRPVEKFDERLAILLDDMAQTMYEGNGVGLAAPQVGVSRRLVAVQRFDREGEPFEFYVNPRIVRYAGGTVRSPEGCLSIPGRIDTAVRRERVVLRYRDGQSGKRRRESVSGFTAVVFQHEIDHLNGILFIDRTPDRAAGNRRHKSSKP